MSSNTEAVNSQYFFKLNFNSIVIKVNKEAGVGVGTYSSFSWNEWGGGGYLFKF